MKTCRTLRLVLPLAVAALTGGCATTPANFKSKESLAISADFKVIKPGKPDQQAILNKLPTGQVTRITYDGKTYYVLPDLAHHRAYVGGPKQYLTYQQLSQAKEQAKEYQADKGIGHQQQMNAAKWGSWEGWGTWESGNGSTVYGGNAVSGSRAAYGWY